MNFFRIILIVGILGLGVIVVFLFLVNRIQNTQPESAGGDSEFPSSQEITPLPESVEEPPDVRVFPETPAGYTIERLPTSGLVTSAVRPDYSGEFADVTSTLFLDVYFIDQCSGANQNERALILTARPNAALGDRQFAETEQAIFDWEANIPRDIGNTLNPGQALSDLDAVDARFTSYDLDTRYTTYSLGNETHEIYYSWVLNFIVFAPSYECLTASINNLYAPHSH